MKFSEIKILQVSPIKKTDKQFGWATPQQQVEATNQNVRPLPLRFRFPQGRG